MEERSININGIECNYKVSGSGEDLLIIHGWGGNSDFWIDVQKELSKNGFKVFTFDLPGFGKTKEPNSIWEVKDYENFVIEFIRKNNLDQFYLIGHSFGGKISIKLASKNILNIKKMILCAPSGIKVNLGIKTNIILFFVNIGKIIPFSFFKNFLKKILYFLIRKRDYAKATSKMREIMKNAIKEEITPLLKDIKVETLLIWGKNDRMVPLKYANIFKEGIRNSSLVVIENSGHSPNKDNPIKLSKEIIKFL